MIVFILKEECRCPRAVTSPEIKKAVYYFIFIKINFQLTIINLFCSHITAYDLVRVQLDLRSLLVLFVLKECFVP